jgi:hypothetical protein
VHTQYLRGRLSLIGTTERSACYPGLRTPTPLPSAPGVHSEAPADTDGGFFLCALVDPRLVVLVDRRRHRDDVRRDTREQDLRGEPGEVRSHMLRIAMTFWTFPSTIL